MVSFRHSYTDKTEFDLTDAWLECSSTLILLKEISFYHTLSYQYRNTITIIQTQTIYYKICVFGPPFRSLNLSTLQSKNPMTNSEPGYLLIPCRWRYRLRTWRLMLMLEGKSVASTSAEWREKRIREIPKTRKRSKRRWHSETSIKFLKLSLLVSHPLSKVHFVVVGRPSVVIVKEKVGIHCDLLLETWIWFILEAQICDFYLGNWKLKLLFINASWRDVPILATDIKSWQVARFRGKHCTMRLVFCRT